MRQVSVLDVLRVIGGEASENQNADSRDREYQGRGGEEDVHDRRDNQANDAHDQEATPARDVLFRGVAPNRQPRESYRGDQENLDDRIARKDQKDRADRNAHDGSENIEQCLRSRGRDFIHRGTQAEDKRQRCKHHNPFQRRHIQRGAEGSQVLVRANLRNRARRIGRHGQAGNSPSRCKGDQHANRHGAIHLIHMGAQPFIDSGGAGSGRRPDCVHVGHEYPPNNRRVAKSVLRPRYWVKYRHTRLCFQELSHPILAQRALLAFCFAKCGAT